VSSKDSSDLASIMGFKSHLLAQLYLHLPIFSSNVKFQFYLHVPSLAP
jgi:hypothetical protein